MAVKTRVALLAAIQQADPADQERNILDSSAIGTQQSHIAAVAVTFSTNNPNITPDGAQTIANGTTPTVAELQAFCVELNAKISALSLALEAFGITAAS